MKKTFGEFKEYLKSYYDERAGIYASSYSDEGRYPSNRFRLNQMLDLISNIEPHPMTILDAGCGDGRAVSELTERGYDCVGFDYSDGMLKEAQEILRSKNISTDIVKIGDIYDIAHADETFDAVICLGVIENLPHHEDVFSELYRVLKPGGRLIVSVENELFSLYTLNTNTLGFYQEILTDIGVEKSIIKKVLKDIAAWLNVDDVEYFEKIIEDRQIDKDNVAIPKYNPLNISEKVSEYKFIHEKTRFYHYHPLPPRFEVEYPSLFSDWAQQLETVDFDWRGAVMCNVMVLQLRK